MITSIILTQPVDSFSCFTHPRFALWFVILTHNCQILIKHDQWSSTTTQPVDSFSCFNHPWFGPSDNQHIAIHSWTHLMMMIILWWLWLWLCHDVVIDWFDMMKVIKSRISVLCLLMFKFEYDNITIWQLGDITWMSPNQGCQSSACWPSWTSPHCSSSTARLCLGTSSSPNNDGMGWDWLVGTGVATALKCNDNEARV